MAGIPHSKEVTSPTSRDIESAQAGFAEAAVSCPVNPRGQWVGLQDSARWRKNVDQGARTILLPASASDDVSFRIETHAINAALGSPVVLGELVQHVILAQGSITQYRVGPQFPYLPRLRVALGHV